MNRFFDPRNKYLSRITVLFGVLLFFVFGLFFVSHGVLAATTPTPLQEVATAGDLSQTSLPLLIARLIRAVLGVLGIITVLLIMYAGFMYMNAHGDPAKVDKAKKIITQTVIGLIIILSSYSIASFIIGRLLAAINGPGTIVSITKKYVEPLAGSLGAGIVESHYPMRDATDVPRNTKIFVTFKEAIKPETIIDGYVKNCTYAPLTCKTDLKVDAVQIFETAKDPKTNKLAKDAVVVTVSDDHKTFVFKPVKWLGNENSNTDYSVALKPIIQKEDGLAAFVGVNSAGYGWHFAVSTSADLTPPHVVSVIPSPSPLLPPGSTVSNALDRNITVEITFNEAMDPIASTGTFDYSEPDNNGKPVKKFDHINVTDGVTKDTAGKLIPKDNKNKLVPINGTYTISNAYTTVDFTTTSWCGKDPCGGNIYCLPPLSTILVNAKAASLDDTNPPQGKLTGVNYTGLVDAAGNSLDGNGDAVACSAATDKVVACAKKSTIDDYTWNFSTTNNVNVDAPRIDSLAPNVGTGSVSVSEPVALTFNTLLKASTINSVNVSLWPDPVYAMWFATGKTDLLATPGVPAKTVISILHPNFIANADGGSNYYPVVTQEVKSAYQICMYPAMGVNADTNPLKACNGSLPFCCNGVASASACKTDGKPAYTTGKTAPLKFQDFSVIPPKTLP